jgi:hypothetical protein
MFFADFFRLFVSRQFGVGSCGTTRQGENANAQQNCCDCGLASPLCVFHENLFPFRLVV